MMISEDPSGPGLQLEEVVWVGHEHANEKKGSRLRRFIPTLYN